MQFVVAADHILELLGACTNHFQQPTRSNSYPLLETNFDLENEIDEKIFTKIQNTDENSDAQVQEEKEKNTEIKHQIQNNQTKPLSIVINDNSIQKLKNRMSITCISSDDSTHTFSFPTNVKQHYEIVDAGGISIKIVTNDACALTSALKELIKVNFINFFFI